MNHQLGPSLRRNNTARTGVLPREVSAWGKRYISPVKGQLHALELGERVSMCMPIMSEIPTNFIFTNSPDFWTLLFAEWTTWLMTFKLTHSSRVEIIQLGIIIFMHLSTTNSFKVHCCWILLWTAHSFLMAIETVLSENIRCPASFMCDPIMLLISLVILGLFAANCHCHISGHAEKGSLSLWELRRPAATITTT